MLRRPHRGQGHRFLRTPPKSSTCLMLTPGEREQPTGLHCHHWCPSVSPSYYPGHPLAPGSTKAQSARWSQGGGPPAQSRCVWDSWSRQSCGGPGPEREEQTLITELLGSRPDSSCFLLALFPDTPLQKMSSLQQLESPFSRCGLAGGVWQAGSQLQPPNHSSST